MAHDLADDLSLEMEWWSAWDLVDYRIVAAGLRAMWSVSASMKPVRHLAVVGRSGGGVGDAVGADELAVLIHRPLMLHRRWYRLI